MPILALLLKGFFVFAIKLWGAQQVAKLGVRITVVGVIAAAYVALALAFSVLVNPLLGSLFSSEYGQLWGLAFPPIAGSVVAGLVGLWIAVRTFRYTREAVRGLVGD